MKRIVEKDSDLAPDKGDYNEEQYDGSGFGDGFGISNKSETYLDYDPSDVYIFDNSELKL